MEVYFIQAIKVSLSLGSHIVDLDPLAWFHESILHLSHVIPQVHGPDLLMQEKKISRKNLNTKENLHWLELLILTMFWKIKRIEKVPKLKASTRHAKLMQCDILSWVLKHIKDKSGKLINCEKTDERKSGVKVITSIFIYLYTPWIWRWPYVLLGLMVEFKHKSRSFDFLAWHLNCRR